MKFLQTQNSELKKILIVDKKGLYGHLLISSLHNYDFLNVTLVSQEAPHYSKVEHVLFINRIPQIPQRKYSHIIIFFNGEKEIVEALSIFSSEADKIKAKLVLVIPVFLIDDQLVNKLRACESLFIIISGEWFGKDWLLNQQGIVSNFLAAAKTKNRIVIKGGGMEKVYPVFFEDAIDKILNILFVKEKQGTFLLFPKHEMTELSLARTFQKADPQIKVDFSVSKEKIESYQDPFIPKDSEYLLDDGYNLLDKIRQALICVDKNMPISHGNDKRQGGFGVFFRICLVSFFLTLIISVFGTGVFSALGYWQLLLAKESIADGNFSLAKQEAGNSQALFSYGLDLSNVFLYQASIFGKRDEAEKIVYDLKNATYLSNLGFDFLTGLDSIINVISQKSSRPKEDLELGLSLAKKAIAGYQAIKTEKNLEKFLPKDIELAQNLLINTIDTYPSILGMESQKRYLILFQNNMELRPGGGFIGSYGILSLDKGRIKELVIHDVYDADGQLKGHIEPPFEIRRYMGIVHWYLRDSNFSVDNTKNASMSAFFLNAETGESVDGVISLDLSLVRNMIAILNSVYVPEYNETVTSDNFYILTQSHAEKNFFPGSRQKRDFLRALFNALQRDLLEKKNISYLKLAETLGNSVAEKHLLFSFSDPTIQNVFSINNMSSSLWDGREDRDNTINDFLGINEANIGINKANYFIKRKVNQEIVIDGDGKVNNKLTIMYKNGKGVWPGGDYKNYLRLILPKDSIISSVYIDGQESKINPAITDFSIYESSKFKPSGGLEVSKVEEGGKTVFGFLVSVPVEKIKKIEISYSLAKRVSVDNPLINYDLFLFKQPGVDQYPFTFSLTYPQGFNMLQSNIKINNYKNNAKLSMDFLKDLKLKMIFAKR